MSLSADELLNLIQAAQANSQNVEASASVVQNTLNQTSESATSQPPELQTHYDIDFSLLDPAIVSQVRSEYLASMSNAKESLVGVDDDNHNIEAAKSITPEVLVKLSQLAKDTGLLAVLREMQQEQHNREKDLWSRREELKDKLGKDREHLMARDMIGIEVAKELEELDTKIASELKKFDQSIIRDMDRQRKRQEEELIKLKVPFFHATQDPVIIKLQSKVFKILLDMMDS